MKDLLTIATRKSPLAIWQANAVKNAITQLFPHIAIDLLPLSTTGDDNPHCALAELGGKALFVKELATAVLQGKADIAVHSAKDMPPEHHPELTLAATLAREDPRDCFIAPQFKTLETMPSNAIIGTSSPRRAAFLQHLYPNFTIKMLRGNVDTRLQKLENEDFHGMILAVAGLKRLGKSYKQYELLPPDTFVPSVGQGTIAIECRKDDTLTQKLLSTINHLPTFHCLEAEQKLIRTLNGNCYSAIGVHATADQETLNLNATVLSPDGKSIIREQRSGNINHRLNLASEMGNYLLQQGAGKLLSHQPRSLT